MLPNFVSVIAESREEALSYLASLEDGKILAGGTDVLPKMRRGSSWRNVVDITRVGDMKGIVEHNGRVSIGSTTTHAAIQTNPIVSAWARSLSVACGWVGSPAIRNMGTLGGNLVNASPAADSLAPLLIHDACAVLESREGMRKVKLDDLIIAPYKTAISHRELLTSIEIGKLSGYREGYRRVTKRAAWAISRLSIAWAIQEENGVYRDVKLAIGSCTPMPFRPRTTEDSLKGKRKSDKVIGDAIASVLQDVVIISGRRPSFVYKLPVLRDLLGEILGGKQE